MAIEQRTLATCTLPSYTCLMRIDMQTAEAELTRKLGTLPDAADIAWATVWLEACGYSGVSLLSEALKQERRSLPLTRDALGLDLELVSCAFLAPAIMRDVKANGRVFLRNVRHGLYMLPFAVRENIGLGCPVDLAFPVGGERHKNPYTEKLDLAAAEGLEIDDAQWGALPPGA